MKYKPLRKTVDLYRVSIDCAISECYTKTTIHNRKVDISCPELKEARINRKLPTTTHPRLQRSRIASLTSEIASITANIDTLKADLKVKKTALKKAEKEVAMLEAKKAKADAKAAEEAKKAEAESVLKKLLAEGMSADEILAKLK